MDDVAAVPGAPRPGLWSAAPRALALWDRRRWLTAAGVAVGVGLLIGVSTVLIPNDWFARDIPTTAWDYPVWVIVSVLSGMLAATYVTPVGGGGAAATGRVSRFSGGAESAEPAESAGPRESAGSPGSPGSAESADSPGARRSARFGAAGAVLGWFAVGCPVCNKLALLALGYTGALQWFAPAQPFLAAVAIALSGAALLVRLRGQVWCPSEAARA